MLVQLLFYVMLSHQSLTLRGINAAPYDGGLWPEGEYALVKPNTGCPKNRNIVWETSTVLFMVGDNDMKEAESIMYSKGLVPAGSHLQVQIMIAGAHKQFIFQYFCVLSQHQNKAFLRSWPSGSYCILGKYQKLCPMGFRTGKFRWQTGDNKGIQITKGTPPAGNYSRNSIELDFCCRADESADKPRALPVRSPFYLLRKGGKCQKVLAMTVHEEYIFFDINNKAPQFVSSKNQPDITDLPDIKLHLCYYTRDLAKGGLASTSSDACIKIVILNFSSFIVLNVLFPFVLYHVLA